MGISKRALTGMFSSLPWERRRPAGVRGAVWPASPALCLKPIRREQLWPRLASAVGAVLTGCALSVRAAAPTDITLSSSSINENNTTNATIGTLGAVGGTSPYSFTLVDPGTFPDNNSFNINGASLRAGISFNFETKTSYSIRVRVTENGGGTFEETLAITINDIAEVAPAIADQAMSIAENSAGNSCHGMVVASDSDGDLFTYSIVSHPDLDDPRHNHEGLFGINPTTGQICVTSDAVVAARYLDFERALDPDVTPGPPYQLEIRVTDRDGRSSSATLTVNVANVYEPPVLLDPIAITIPEHTSGEIASLTAYDPDSLGSNAPPVTFSLTAGHQVGGVSVFTIDSTSGILRIVRPDMFDFESNTVFNVTVRISDGHAPANTDTTTLTVNVSNAKPLLRSLSLFILANAVEGSIIGVLDFDNPDGNAVNFTVTDFRINSTPQASPDDAFHVDDRNQLILDKDGVELFGSLDPNNTPTITLTLTLTDSVTFDSTVATLPLILQRFPGGSPVMLDPTAGIGGGTRTEGDPVQDVAAGPGSEIIVIGTARGRGYLKVYPRGLLNPRVVDFGTEFMPTAVAADAQWVYVAGQTGDRPINYKARLMENQPDKVEPGAATPSRSKVIRYPLKTTDTSAPIEAYPFSFSYDSTINDMVISEGSLFLCGGVRWTQVGTADPLPYTYQPIWAKLDSDLNWRDGRAISPNNPSSQAQGGFGWLDASRRAYYSMFTAIAVAPDGGDLYLGGYNFAWEDRDGGIRFGNGWIAQLKRRDNGSYGDAADAGDAAGLLLNETWISDGGNQNLGLIGASSPPRAYLNMTLIKDLVFVKGSRKSTLYAYQEYRGKGLPYPNMKWRGVAQTGEGYDNERATPLVSEFFWLFWYFPLERSLDLKIARFSPSLLSDTGTGSAYIHAKTPQPTQLENGQLVPAEVRAGTMTADAEGNIYVSGMIPAGLTVSFGSGTMAEAVHSRDRFFVAKYDSELTFQWVQIFTDGTYTPVRRPSAQFGSGNSTELDFPTTPSHPPMGPAVIEWHPAWHSVLVGGNFTGGQVEARLGNEVNWITPPGDGSKGGFLTLLSSDNRFVKSQGLVIQSIADTDGRSVGSDALIRPYLGGAAPAVGDTITVQVPKYIYAERDSVGNEIYLGTYENPPTEDVIRTRAVNRYVNTGITVGNHEFHTDSTSYTFVFSEGSTITINWQPEHAVIIENDLSGTGATLSGGLWTRGADSLGLTSTAAGEPDPAADKHWIRENELFTGFINGTELDPASFGTRYAVIGYDALGRARTDGGALDMTAAAQAIRFDKVEPKHQVTPFVVKGPAKLTWKWKPQHRIQISTSSSRSDSLPRIRVIDTSNQVDFPGVGEAWYDRGTRVTMGARDDDAPGQSGQRLYGWLNSSGQFQTPLSAPDGRDRLTHTFIQGGATYRGFQLPVEGLLGPILVLWNYGDTIYREVVTLGGAVSFTDVAFPIAEITTTSGRKRRPDRARFVAGPPGSTGDTMQQWDDVAKMTYPVRPGVFFLEWDRPNSDSKMILEVRSGFGGDRVFPTSTTDLSTFALPKRHYRHLAHENMPAVALDADLADPYSFLSLEYTESDGLVAHGAFNAQRPGRHVLLFSQSNAGGVPAIGDRSRETLVVRVVETRRWNAVYDATDPEVIVKGAWNDAVGTAMLIEADPNTDPAIIGRKLTSSLDRASLMTGFIISPLARYDLNIHDNTKIADAGPIIPVNRHFTSSDDDDLIVAWYEHSESGATQPANINWPWQSARYETRWPDRSDLTLVLDSGGAEIPQPLDRIVVASRLGSEGHNYNGVVQAFFDRERFDQVRIYSQPDRTLPGYNPNEEHALTAPSFKYLDQANPPTAAFALRNDLNITTQDSTYTSDPYVLVEFFDKAASEFKMAVYAIELEDNRISLNPYRYPGVDPDPTNPDDQREFPYTFNYPMKAGEPVQPPYPLGLVIGLTPCDQTSGENLSPGRVYWEDHRGQPWAVSDGRLRSYFYYPQLVNFWNGEGAAETPTGACLRFRTDGPIIVTGLNTNPTFAAGSQFLIAGQPVNVAGTTPASFVASVNALGGAVSAELLPGGEIRLRSATPIQLADGANNPLAAAGIAAPLTYQPTPGVTYNATWPEVLPILKAGETLTFAGGEYKADHPGPDQPGLPGVVGWAAGKIVFDSRNPGMNNQTAFDNYAGRLVSPLEDRRVKLSDSEAATLEAAIQPALGLTQVVGEHWKFKGLPSSLGKRIFYDPLLNELFIRGYLNDRTLGDSDLTATPPPVYVLEPDILTRRERDTLFALPGLSSLPVWSSAVSRLYSASRNPEGIAKASPDPDPYYVGLELDVVQQNNNDQLDESGDPITIPNSARHRSALGPGLALVASPHLLEPGDPNQVNYLTLAENDDASVGGPVSLFIIKIEKKHRYRGAIKTILSDNVFDERITLRHTADFGGNGDDIVYQWFYHEEDGNGAPLPPDPAWKLFVDQSDTTPKGLGLYQIALEGTGGLILADNLFFTRYRHRLDTPPAGPNSVNWAGTEWTRDGADYRDPEAKDPLGNPDDDIKFGGQFAGAANSPTVDLVYRAQLVMGWIKRVFDRVNPYEARFSDFLNNTAPATYANMIQEAGRRSEGPVALNPDKNVIENVGLIELYQTILDRGISLSLGLSSPITTPGINNALLLAATRISDLYALLGNEAYSDALDPTIGFGSSSVEYGTMAPAVHAFQNQVSSLLEEELALLRGVDDSYGRPVYNRLFWNFTKGEGEVAYAMNYNIKDVNQDGFIDESDALMLHPQGHGDAWGSYLTAIKTRYSLLRHPFFNWQTRSEYYNLLDVVIPVDYLDERKFAEVAAAKAQVGTEVVNSTYRSQYVDDPDGQWQGYTDPVPRREWGVAEWARRAGQGALFDWITANALIPSRDPVPTHQGIQRIERKTVPDLMKVSANLGSVQTTYDTANTGLNPLGLDSDVVPFDLDPTFAAGFQDIGPKGHFEQIYDRAVDALGNALAAFDYANARKLALRQLADDVDQARLDAIAQDLDYRNRLIEIFGTPYRETIGTGKPYPAGYSGPDLSLYMYVDVNGVTPHTVPAANATYAARLNGFANDMKKLTDDYGLDDVIKDNFLGSLDSNLQSWTGVVLSDNSVLNLNLPASAGTYTFQAPVEWGQRAAVGRLQQAISDMVQTEAELSYAVGNYDVLINQIEHQANAIEAKYGVSKETIKVKTTRYNTFIALNVLINALKVTSASTIFTADITKNIADATADGLPKVVGLANDAFFGGRLTLTTYGATAQYILRLTSLIAGQAADIADSSKDLVGLRDEIEIDKENFKYEIKEQLKDLEEMLINEGTTRIAVFRLKEQLRSQADQYRSTLQEGIRLMQEREIFNQKTAAATQGRRYQDMALRVSRNDALEKYRAAFDLASRYAYLAAKAFDFETSLAANDPYSPQPLFNEVIRARGLGAVADGEPLHPGGGLAETLATLRDNFRALKPQIGLNNPHFEWHTFSMRQELLGIGSLPSSDDLWRAQLTAYRKDNLWDSPEFRRFCRPFGVQAPGNPEPGLIIPFRTEITAGRNFFGNPLQPGHSAFDPSRFATKIRSVGVQMIDYDTSTLSQTPRVYLIPAGMDGTMISTSRTLQTRFWNVVDQKIPPPFKTGTSDLADPDYIPAVDSLTAPFGEIRRLGSFLAFPGDTEEVVLDTGIVGRSVWNTQWLLVIPGRSMLNDADAGLNTFIDTITDITLSFETYGTVGN